MADLDLAKKALDAFLRADEGESLVPYLCQAGVPTIGVGATTYLDGRKVTMADPPISKAQMDRMLAVEIDRYCGTVLHDVEGKCSTNQLIGLVRLAYNIGLAALASSTVIKRHKAGDYVAAARAFSLWDKYRAKPGGPLLVSEGLAVRRLREAAVYATPDDNVTEPIPQAVAPQSKLPASPIVQGASVAGGVGVLDAVAQAKDALGPVGQAVNTAKTFLADSLGLPAKWIVPCVIVMACIVILRWRFTQRAEGRA